MNTYTKERRKELSDYYESEAVGAGRGISFKGKRVPFKVITDEEREDGRISADVLRAFSSLIEKKLAIFNKIMEYEYHKRQATIFGEGRGDLYPHPIDNKEA
jgi:hypothetical protein